MRIAGGVPVLRLPAGWEGRKPSRRPHFRVAGVGVLWLLAVVVACAVARSG